MTLWDMEKCNSSLAWNGKVYDTFMCAGYYSGVRSVCRVSLILFASANNGFTSTTSSNIIGIITMVFMSISFQYYFVLTK